MDKIGHYTAIVVLLLAPAAYGVPFFEDFESYEVGETPGAPWITATPWATIVSDDWAVSGRKSVRLYREPGTSDWAYLRYDFPGVPELTMQFYILNIDNWWATLEIWGDDRDWVGNFQMTMDGWFRWYSDPDPDRYLTPYENQRWYLIELRVNSIWDRIDIFIDGTPYGRYMTGDVDLINSVSFRGEATDFPFPNHFYVDDVNIEPIPEPATILLLSGGLSGLVGYVRRELRKRK